MYNRPYKTRLPQYIRPVEDKEVQEKNEREKQKQKMYKDDNRNVKPHTIKKGDQVLMRQNMTKTQSRYDPRPFKVDEVHGSQITVSRDGSKKTRDAQKLKKVNKSTENCYKQLQDAHGCCMLTMT